MKKRFRIALALGIALLCLLSIVVLLNLRGRFLDGYYLAFEVNTDKESCNQCHREITGQQCQQ